MILQTGPVSGGLTINNYGGGTPPAHHGATFAAAEGAWQAVRFLGTGKLASALRGDRLGPREAAVCPRLPEVAEVEVALRATCCAVLTGDSGCGKSVTAYQVMADRVGEGWKAIRLRDSARNLDGDSVVDDLLGWGGPLIALVDDAQSVSDDTLRAVLEAAGPERWLLVANTGELRAPAPVVRVARGRAVAALHAALSEDLEALTREVRSLDPRVGDDRFDDRIERRLHVAAEQPTPWQFCFVLSGGWRRVAGQLAGLRERDSAHLALAVVAIGQISTADAGAPFDRLSRMSASFGRDADWLGRCLGVLRREQLISNDEGFYRCTHVQAAWATLRSLAVSEPDKPPANEVRIIARLFDGVLQDPATSLVGISWLLSPYGFYSDECRALTAAGALGSTTVVHLVERATTGNAVNSDVGVRARIISDLNLWRDEVSQHITSSAAVFGSWVDTMTYRDAGGIGSLFNWLGTALPTFSQDALRDVDVADLTQRWVASGLEGAALFSEAIDRICWAGGPALRAEVAGAVDAETMISLCRSERGELWALYLLAEEMAWLNPELSLRMVAAFLPRLALAFNADPAQTWVEANKVLFFVLGFAPDFLRHREPTKKQKRIAAKLATMLDPDAFAAAFARSKPRDWEDLAEVLAFVHEAEQERFRSIVAVIDLVALGQTVEPHFGENRVDVLGLFLALAETRPDEVGELVGSMLGSLDELVAPHAMMAPAQTIEALCGNASLDLWLSEHRWEFSAAAVTALAAVAPVTTKLVIIANREALKRGLLLEVHGDDHKGLLEFVRVYDELRPDEVDSALSEILEEAEPHWRRGLSERGAGREVVRELVRRAARACPGHEVVRRLQRRFPSLRKPG
ncbi:hypothetical protein GCM10010428_63770 [Actinosynnema pretiosum subsp. pretiosum]